MFPQAFEVFELSGERMAGHEHKNRAASGRHKWGEEREQGQLGLLCPAAMPGSSKGEERSSF